MAFRIYTGMPYAADIIPIEPLKPVPGGAFYSREKDQDASNGFQIGAAYGLLVGLGAGAVFETFRLTEAYETKEAGDANVKMTFLALKDWSILYTNYSTVGYVYFSRSIRESDRMPTITIPLIR